MYGWTTWGNVEDPRESYKEIGPLQLFKHWTGPIVAVPEKTPRLDAFLMLAQMNDYLEALHETTQPVIPFETVPADDVPCGSDHCREC